MKDRQFVVFTESHEVSVTISTPWVNSSLSFGIDQTLPGNPVFYEILWRQMLFFPSNILIFDWTLSSKVLSGEN
jgi:hypothetical protein